MRFTTNGYAREERWLQRTRSRWATAALLLPLGLAALLSAPIRGAPSAPAGPRPNIILILADDLGYSDLGCYGQKLFQTPRIDQLAAEGTRFTQVYAGSCVCAPSRCALMTGLHNGHGRIRDNLPQGIFLQPDDLTVAEVLKRAGYQTGAIGKWSLGDPGTWGVPNYQGFDYFYGHLNQVQAHFYYPDHLWENDRVVQLAGNRGGKKQQYTHDLFTEHALRFIEQQKQRPFFLYLAYTIPHWSDYPKNTPESQIVPSDAPYTGRDWPQVEKNHAAMVTRLDADVGRIADHLQKLGLESNTLLLLTSDNGPSGEASHSVEFFDSNGPLRGAKRDLYEGGIRVPMIARWPGRVPAGRTSDQVWAFWDFLPTAAELAGLPPPAGVDGLSMVSALLGKPAVQEHDYLYWDYGHTREIYAQAVRWKNWKGVRNGRKAALELYDLAQDVAESRDVASAHPEVVERMRNILQEAPTASDDYPAR